MTDRPAAVRNITSGLLSITNAASWPRSRKTGGATRVAGSGHDMGYPDYPVI
jgi:hypothetical protein